MAGIGFGEREKTLFHGHFAIVQQGLEIGGMGIKVFHLFPFSLLFHFQKRCADTVIARYILFQLAESAYKRNGPEVLKFKLAGIFSFTVEP